MTSVKYKEIQAGSALNRVRGMDFKWSLNPYQGCVHGCHYCFARRYHYLMDLDPNENFSNMISVKSNLPQVLAKELSRPSWKKETIAIGTATDPYQPIEGKYELTRRCLEVLLKKRNPIGLVTKGTLAVRDADLLAELTNEAGCTLCFSITTLNNDLWQRLEPGTPPPQKRLQALEKLVSAGVNAGVLLAPIIPGITDDEDNLREVTCQAAEHGARFLSGTTLYLKQGTKEHFFSFLGDNYPRLLTPYKRMYPGAYPPWRVKQELTDNILRLKRTYGLDDKEPLHPVNQQPRQLQLVF